MKHTTRAILLLFVILIAIFNLSACRKTLNPDNSNGTDDETTQKQTSPINDSKETSDTSPINDSKETSVTSPIRYERAQQTAIIFKEYCRDLESKGWENVGVAWDGISDGGIVIAGIENVVFPAPTLSEGQYIYTAAGMKRDVRGIISVAIMFVFDEGATEGSLVDMFYAINSGKTSIVHAKHFDYEIFTANNEQLWDYMLSQ